jgi:hypothetical protein
MEPVEAGGGRTPPVGEEVWAEARERARVGIASVLIVDTPSPMKGAPPAWRQSAPDAAPT